MADGTWSIGDMDHEGSTWLVIIHIHSNGGGWWWQAPHRVSPKCFWASLWMLTMMPHIQTKHEAFVLGWVMLKYTMLKLLSSVWLIQQFNIFLQVHLITVLERLIISHTLQQQMELGTFMFFFPGILSTWTSTFKPVKNLTRGVLEQLGKTKQTTATLTEKKKLMFGDRTPFVNHIWMGLQPASYCAIRPFCRLLLSEVTCFTPLSNSAKLMPNWKYRSLLAAGRAPLPAADPGSALCEAAQPVVFGVHE